MIDVPHSPYGDVLRGPAWAFLQETKRRALEKWVCLAKDSSEDLTLIRVSLDISPDDQYTVVITYEKNSLENARHYRVPVEELYGE